MRSAWLLLIALLACTHCGAGVTYVHDEVLWTKQRWDEFMLDFPWAKFKHRESDYNRIVLELTEFEKHTLNGPVGAIDQLVGQDIKRGPRLHQASFEVSLLDDQAAQDEAAGVAGCKVCIALASQLWKGLVAWVDVHQKLPSQSWIHMFAVDLCEYEVANAVLSEWVILRARVEQGKGLPLAKDGQGQEFYLLTQRSKQHATPQEIQAARRACVRVLTDEAAIDQKASIVKLTITLLEQYYRKLMDRLGRPVAEGVALVEEGPQAERGCYNRHPQCTYWARVGECTGNPTYMTGLDQPEKGWCRPACNACSPPSPPKPSFGPEDAAFMETVATALMSTLHSKACINSSPCQWAPSGAASNSLLAKASGEAAAIVQEAAFISGPLQLGGAGPAKAVAAGVRVDEGRLRASKVFMQRKVADAVVTPQHFGREGAHKPLATPPEEFKTEAGKVIWQHYGNRCLYSTTGWWSYEVCLWRHLHQLHMAGAGDPPKVDWVISLGKYDPSRALASNWQPRFSTTTYLYPKTKVAYVTHRYVEGNICELDPPEGNAPPAEGAEQSPRPVIWRQAEVMLMCSPDLEPHIWIKEPAQCRYVVEVYLPALCQVEGFEVRSGSGGSSGAAAGGGSVGVRNGGSSSGGGGGSSSGGSGAQQKDKAETHDEL